MSFRKMRWSVMIVSMFTLSLACSQQKPAPFTPEDLSVRDDREAPFNPSERYPEWAFDQPEFVRPAAAPTPEPPARGTDPAHFFTNKRTVMVQQPTGYTPEETPRVAIYYSDDNGFNWKRAGFFGREQSFFPLETDKDGDYGVRFVGPGQAPAEHTPARGERVYHVDTGLPQVEIHIDPEKALYKVGENIRIVWAARDPHLEQFPVRLGMLMDFTAMSRDLIELQRDLPDEGSIEYRISSETAGHEIVFRAEALDRAGNLGLAYSHALQVEGPDDDQFADTAARHHDDTLKTTRNTTPLATDDASDAAATELVPVAAQTSASPPEKTRVRVVTLEADGPRVHERQTRPAGQQTAPMANVVSPSNDRTVTDAEFVQMLDCDERAAFEAAASPPEPTASSDSAVPVAKAADPVATLATINTEVLEPLKRAVSKISELSEESQAASRDGSSAVEAAPPATPVTAAVRPDRPSPVKLTAAAAPAASPKPVAVKPAKSAPVFLAPPDRSRGSALVMPMPGTVSSQASPSETTAHPWRTLRGPDQTGGELTWALPAAKATVNTAPVERTASPVFAGTPKEDEMPTDD